MLDGGVKQLLVPQEYELNSGIKHFTAYLKFAQVYSNSASLIQRCVNLCVKRTSLLPTGDFEFCADTFCIMWGHSREQTEHIDAQKGEFFGIMSLSPNIQPTTMFCAETDPLACAQKVLGEGASEDDVMRLRKNLFFRNYHPLLLDRQHTRDHSEPFIDGTLPLGSTYFIQGGIVHAAPANGSDTPRARLFFSCTPESCDSPYDHDTQITKFTLLHTLYENLSSMHDKNAARLMDAFKDSVWEYADAEPWKRYEETSYPYRVICEFIREKKIWAQNQLPLLHIAHQNLRALTQTMDTHIREINSKLRVEVPLPHSSTSKRPRGIK